MTTAGRKQHTAFSAPVIAGAVCTCAAFRNHTVLMPVVDAMLMASFFAVMLMLVNPGRMLPMMYPAGKKFIPTENRKQT